MWRRDQTLISIPPVRYINMLHLTAFVRLDLNENMSNSTNFLHVLTEVLTFTIIFKFVLFFIKYHWSRRWLYYYASKFDGPFSLPLIGTAYYFMGSLKDVTNKAMDLVNKNGEVFRVWIVNNLFIVNSRPEDVEIILRNCLEKTPLYKLLTGGLVNNSILLSPVNRWRKNRKIINTAFNPKIINSFQDVFVKYSNVLVEELQQKNLNKPLDIFSMIWKCNFQSSFETLFDTKEQINYNQVIDFVMRIEEICSQRLSKAWLYPKFAWKSSSLYKELQSLSYECRTVGNNIIEHKRSEQIDDEMKRNRFINLLKSIEMSEKELFHNSYLMFIASTETVALALSYVLLVFGIHPEIQKKAYEEIRCIFGDSERDASVEDLARMEYLERVIKETMRLFPAAILLARYVDEDFKSGDYIYPKGSTIIIPVISIHRSPKLWKDPLKFDPERFLPEETQKRHRCSYIPFSYGSRNCPGAQYAMVSMKTMMSRFMRKYEVVSCDYQSIEDIKLVLNLVSKPDKGFKVVLSKR